MSSWPRGRGWSASLDAPLPWQEGADARWGDALPPTKRAADNEDYDHPPKASWREGHAACGGAAAAQWQDGQWEECWGQSQRQADDAHEGAAASPWVRSRSHACANDREEDYPRWHSGWQPAGTDSSDDCRQQRRWKVARLCPWGGGGGWQHDQGGSSLRDAWTNDANNWQPSSASAAAAAPCHEDATHGAEPDYLIHAAAGRHRCTIVWLHSCHGRPSHIEDFVDDLRANGVLPEGGCDGGSVRVRAPCAPSRYAGPEWTGTSFQWFVYADDDDGTCDVPLLDQEKWGQLRSQRVRLQEILLQELRLLPHDGTLVLGGLSQGASMALDVLLHVSDQYPWLSKKIKGVFARRTLLQPETVHDFLGACKKMPDLSGLTVFATHGTSDECVNIDKAWETYKALRSSGAQLVFHAMDGIWHTGYSLEESKGIAGFVARVIGGDGGGGALDSWTQR